MCGSLSKETGKPCLVKYLNGCYNNQRAKGNYFACRPDHRGILEAVRVQRLFYNKDIWLHDYMCSINATGVFGNVLGTHTTQLSASEDEYHCLSHHQELKCVLAS